MPVLINSDPLKDAVTNASRVRRTCLTSTAVLETIAPTPRNNLLPDWELQTVAVVDLKLPARQVRKLNPENVLEAANSISYLGYSAPIIINAKYEVINGVSVVEAAKRLGLLELRCVLLSHLTSPQERVLRLALNRIGAQRQYDMAELKLEFEELIYAQEPIEIGGFTTVEIDVVLAPPLEVVADDAELPLVGPPVIQPGDVVLLGEHRLLCGDAKSPDSYAALMREERAQLTITDPPYAVATDKVVSTKHRDFIEGGGDMTQAGFEAMITASFGQARDYLVKGGMLLSFMDWKHCADLVVIGKKVGLEHINTITWVKSQGGMGSLWRSQTEFVVALKVPGKHKNNIQLGKFGRDRTNAWQYPGAGTVGTDARKMLEHHPTPKPVPMLADAIVDVTDRGDIVLDPFGGSDSTLIAAEQTGRIARIMELDPFYCDLIVRRWEQVTGDRAVFEATGETFAIVEARIRLENGDDQAE